MAMARTGALAPRLRLLPHFPTSSRFFFASVRCSHSSPPESKRVVFLGTPAVRICYLRLRLLFLCECEWLLEFVHVNRCLVERASFRNQGPVVWCLFLSLWRRRHFASVQVAADVLDALLDASQVENALFQVHAQSRSWICFESFWHFWTRCDDNGRMHSGAMEWEFHGIRFFILEFGSLSFRAPCCRLSSQMLKLYLVLMKDIIVVAESNVWDSKCIVEVRAETSGA